MSNEEFQKLVLEKFDKMDFRLANVEKDLGVIKKDVKNIKTDLKGVWQDILRLDNRVSEIEERQRV